jgi:hypothetical protein
MLDGVEVLEIDGVDFEGLVAQSDQSSYPTTGAPEQVSTIFSKLWQVRLELCEIRALLTEDERVAYGGGL